MKPFRFTLEAVRTLRHRRERAALEAYARALQAHRQALERVGEAERDLHAAWRELQRQWREGTCAADVARASAACQWLEERRQKCEAAARASQQAVHQSLQKWLAARQALEVIDKCREQQHRRHARQVQAREQKELDDLANRGAPWEDLSDVHTWN